MLGAEIWVTPYNGPNNLDDIPVELVYDGSQFLYVTGSMAEAGGDRDFLTVKYNTSGAAFYHAVHNGPRGGNDIAEGFVCDPHSHIYVTGMSQNGDEDYSTIKYEDTGQDFTVLWKRR